MYSYSGTYDPLGNGYFEDVYEDRPTYENRSREETYQQPVYRDQPVYRQRVRYEIENGTISFSNTNQIAPFIDVRARADIKGYDLDLWQRIRRTLNAFLLRVWRDGACRDGVRPSASVMPMMKPPISFVRGEASLMDVAWGCLEIGVRWLSAYAFSTENWKRSPDEVRFLMGFNRDVIRRRPVWISSDKTSTITSSAVSFVGSRGPQPPSSATPVRR